MTGEPRYFLTAFGLALKHGFQGTEEEWLESLTAYGQALSTGFVGSYEEWLLKIADPVPRITIGETITLEAGLPASVEITGSKENPVLHFGIPRGEGLEDALMKTGGTMSGALSMGNNALKDLPPPEDPNDAVRRSYVDAVNATAEAAAKAATSAKSTADAAKSTAEAALPKSGGTMTGTLDMGGKSITNVPDPSEDHHAANMGYVKSYADTRHKVFTVSLTAEGWTGDGPYTQAVELEGILATDTPHYGAVYSDTVDTALAQKEAYALVDELDTADGSVTFTCFEEKPEVAISIQMEVNR